MSLSSYASYFALVVTLVFSPGPMTLFLMANGMRAHMKQLYPILIGANHTYLLAIVIFSAGLAELLQRHVLLFKSFQAIGILYLIYLAKKQWYKKSLHILDETLYPHTYKKFRLYTRGALIALSNPKTILLFTLVFPQFTAQNANYYWQICILGGTFLLLQFFSGCFYAFLGTRIQTIIQNPLYQIYISRLSALVLLIVAIFLIARI